MRRRLPESACGGNVSGKCSRARIIWGKTMKTISVIVPCYNEESTVLTFFGEAERVRRELFTPLDVDFEYLFVDDGSTDKTLEHEWDTLLKRFLTKNQISFDEL